MVVVVVAKVGICGYKCLIETSFESGELDSPENENYRTVCSGKSVEEHFSL